jgi:hypothetical protein
MKHVIYGGDGFVGRHLAARLVRDGETVVVCDIVKSDLPHYAQCTFVPLDVTDRRDFDKVTIQPARHGLQPGGQDALADPGARQAPRLLLAGQLPRHRKHHPQDGCLRRHTARALHDRHGLRPHLHLSADRGAPGKPARRIRSVEMEDRRACRHVARPVACGFPFSARASSSDRDGLEFSPSSSR